MLTKNEINALSLSPTKKDFVQIWNELLEVAGKLSERWDPTSTNESDPGIVILKALTGIADKLNYNIDKNTLEAFMPTASQEDSMRKLCDMLGYSIKYYRSAETSVNIRYYNSDPTEEELEALELPGLLIPKFTVITNSDKDISYFTTNQTPVYISLSAPSVKIKCMEGQIVKCESTTDNNVITAAQISENNRFYLPEAQIAENGIFVYNVFSSDGTTLEDGQLWDRVDNLNIQAHGSRVFKFGYDSYESRPYIEFPTDYTALINDGLFIYYARTSGAQGNVSPRTLTQLETPNAQDWDKVSTESFNVENIFAANTGANIETIQQAYTNFKKTIGTFETLVTCRDYMNKIYTMTDDETGRPLVSNALVTDIRTDLNRAITICSCDDAGIFYKETPMTKTVTKTLKVSGSTSDYVTVEDTEPLINHFDLVLYPFKAYSQIKGNVKDIQEVYDSSFRYSSQSFDAKLLDTDSLKTIAHNVIAPNVGDTVCINNYLRLNAIISTNSKITTEEGALLVDTIKIALANAFNMRELDFGEEIPFESIVEVIEKADSRIKMVSLNEPALYTTFSVFEGTDKYGKSIVREYAVASDWLTEDDADKSGRFEIKKDSYGNYTDGTFNTLKAKQIYNKLAVRNVLAGRVPLFKYNNTFKTSFSEGAYRTTAVVPEAGAVAAGLAAPTRDNPFTLFVDQASGKTYTGQLTPVSADEVPEGLTPPAAPEVATFARRAAPAPAQTQQTDTNASVTYLDENGQQHNASGSAKYICELDENGQPVYSKIVYTETSTPEEYANNIITKDPEDTTNRKNITEITTSCKIYADETTDTVSQVTLAQGEFIKFRAPNFITTKTYPAYVNYHLDLNQDLLTEAVPAEAADLATLLANNFEAILTYFSGSDHKGTIALTQKVSNTNNKPVIDVDAVDTSKKDLSSVLQQSGFVKVKLDAEGRAKPIIRGEDGAVAPEIPASFLDRLDLAGTDAQGKVLLKSFIITSEESSIFGNLTDYVDSVLQELPTEDVPSQNWSISYEFEYVPFESSTLAEWENFIKAEGETLFGFQPVDDAGTIFWRIVDTGGYAAGKYILANGTKLRPFNSTYFGLLNSYTSYLHGVYVAKTVGKDAKANIIPNNEEYELRTNEYLYIEYTPSTTTEDGTSKTLDAVKEIHGPGTIIRPNGFTEGLEESTIYAQSHSPVKSIEFKLPDGSTKNIALFSFGANEQVEIRELSQVKLNKDFIANSDTVYIYKNFNDCEVLEGSPDYDGGKRVNNTYTLKDGEYVFYTDSSKTELAYYTSGTDVSLHGDVVLPKFDIIDIATIFESGLQEIPWYPISFAGDRGITFQEFQYITLGPGDTLKSATINGQQQFISDTPQACEGVEYFPAGADTTEPTKLPKINTSSVTAEGGSGSSSGGSSSGWKVSSVLELDTSPSSAQTLRKTSNVETSISLYTPDSDRPISKLEAADADHPLSFKTNLACQSNNGQVKIADLYSNPNNLKSFELKVFSEEVPKIANMKPGTLVPYTGAIIEDTVSTTTTTASFAIASYGELWSQAPMTGLTTAKKDDIEYDRALKLSVSILPNTYGIFSIYLDCPSSALDTSKAWIELQPGVSRDTFVLFNVSTEEANKAWEIGDDGVSRLMLKPGLNCIRVNKTGNIYIKAADDSEGVLYFDELRLVDATKISYTKNGQTEYQATHGLNLAQIGYLAAVDKNISDKNFADTFNAMDKRVRQKLKTDYTDIAIQKLDNKATEYEKSFSTGQQELLASAQKVQNLIDFADNLSKELAVIEDNKSDMATLLAKYNEICADLENEIDLKNALIDNKPINELEKQLAEMLGNVTDIETAKQELLDELEETRQTALANADSFTGALREDILDDFKLAAESENQPELIAKLKQASIEKIDAEYGKQLDLIAKSLDEVANSEAATKLAEVVEKLKTQTPSPAGLDTIVANLKDTKDNKVSTLAGRLDTITTKRNSDISIATAFGTADGFDITTDYTLLPFADELINSIWPDYMKLAFVAGVNELYSSVRSVVKGTSTATELVLSNKFYATGDITVERTLLVKQANKASFEEMFAKAKDISFKETRSTARNELINTLGESAVSSTELYDAMTAIVVGESSRNAVLRNIVSKLQGNPTAAEKQQLINMLLEELESEITLDTKLLSITADLICPSLLNFEDRHAYAKADDFYSALKLTVADAKNILLDSDDLAEALADLNSIVDASITQVVLELKELLASNNPEIFRESLSALLDGLTEESFAGTLLASDYVEKLFNLVNIINKQEQLSTIKGCKLFTLLLNENLTVAWEYTQDNWMDSSGNYFKVVGTKPTEKWKTSIGETVTVDLLRDKDGVWRYNNAKRDAVIIKNDSGWLIDGTEYILLDAGEDNLEINSILADLLEDTGALGQIILPEYLKGTYDTLTLESLLLEDIRNIDTGRDFYYNVPIEQNVALDFIESDKKLNTLMNPAVNYDINNVNNTFVMSKLDINFLTDGIQIARSSRIS